MEMNNINNFLSSDFHPLKLSSVPPEETSTTQQNPRKKRTKFIRIGAGSGTGTSTSQTAPGLLAKPTTTRRPDPAAPKITRPCTECGKKFWSWKALFGHMRCHPERQWRGINPPPNFRRPDINCSLPGEEDSSSVTDEDHEVATCLLMLANGPVGGAASDQSPSHVTTAACGVNQGTTPEYSDSGRDADQNINSVDGVVNPAQTISLNCGRFECSSCKKVFGSHQALGGHRASHKNVKGCYAITKNDVEELSNCCLGEMIKDNNIGGHKCSICSRVFSSGQALGGHMRCHWEKVEYHQEVPSGVCGFDLNLAADSTVQDDDAYSSCIMDLDLRLGL